LKGGRVVFWGVEPLHTKLYPLRGRALEPLQRLSKGSARKQQQMIIIERDRCGNKGRVPRVPRVKEDQKLPLGP